MPLESVVCLDPFYAGEEVDVGAEDEEYKVHKQVKHAGDGTEIVFELEHFTVVSYLDFIVSVDETTDSLLFKVNIVCRYLDPVAVVKPYG